MSEKAQNQASLNESLEQLSAFEKSMASFGMDDLDSERAVILKDWSAQDFANIYVRFRPHLLSHARKFLREEIQAEEVVQDAFLYLMTALPELDSELGVLRFLKWKTKMLCLDIIRASQAGPNNNLFPLPEDILDETQPLDSLERADDAAIIRLALAKLNPRHREALLATMYEEKSHQEVARQMGVSENALRQLLFRARASFRQALVGEAEIEGKTVAEILTLAARKATSSRNTFVATVLIMVSVALSPLLGNNIEMAERGQTAVASPASSNQVSPDSGSSEAEPDEASPSDSLWSVEASAAEADELTAADPKDAQAVSLPSSQRLETDPFPSYQEDEDTRLALEAFNEFLDETIVSKLASNDLKVSELEGQLTAANDSGLRASFAVDLDSHSIVQFVVIEFESDGQVWKAVPGNSLSVVEELNGSLHVSYAATDFLVGDFSGDFDYVSTTESIFSRSGIKLDVVFDGDGGILSSRVAFLPKT